MKKILLSLMLIMVCIGGAICSPYTIMEDTSSNFRIKIDNKEESNIKLYLYCLYSLDAFDSNNKSVTATYTSSNNDVASIVNNTTVLTKKNGSAIITGNYKGLTDFVKITIIDGSVRIAKIDHDCGDPVYTYSDFNLDLNSQANLGIYYDNDNKVRTYLLGLTPWSSSNEDVIIINDGKVKAIGYGKSTIKAVLPNGQSDTITITVPGGAYITSVKLDKASLSLQKGKTTTLKATVSPTNVPDKSVSWKSSNTKVATVTSAGVIKGISKGTATITATTNGKNKSGNKLTATCKVTVTDSIVKVTSVKLDKSTLSIKTGNTATLKATITPSNATTKTVTWKTSDTKIATVSSSGVIKGVKAGTATITVTTKDGSKTAKCKVTVTNIKVTGVKLNKTTLTLAKGKKEKLVATISPSNANNKSVTWTSSNKSIAYVSGSGEVKGVKAGTATITVTTKDGSKKATCKVTVK